MKQESIFFMAHQDDEFGVFHQIEREIDSGRLVRCVYVTDGAATANPDRRDRESMSVLQNLGVSESDILFIGRQLSIGDGKLYCHATVLVEWLCRFFDDHKTIKNCFVPAWEGGHPDHDLLHAIVVEVLLRRTNPPAIWQYPIYNGKGCVGPFFRVLSPLPENGSVTQSPITWRNRFRYLRLCLSYPSQWRTWIGLFPFVFAHYVLSGVQQLQRVDSDRIIHPPHARPLYYERRGFLDWPTLRSVLKQLSDKESAKLSAPDIPVTPKHQRIPSSQA